MISLRRLLLLLCCLLSLTHTVRADFEETYEISADGDVLEQAPSPTRVVTMKNHYDNQTLMILWTGSLDDDESHISDPILVTEALPLETVKVNTFNGHIFLIQVKETLKVVGDKITILRNKSLYELGPRSAKSAKKVAQQSTKKRAAPPLQYERDPNLPYPHPNPHIQLLGTITTAMSAKFRALVPSMDMWYEDGRGGSFQGTLTLGRESTTNTYEGHVFFFTETGNKDNEYARFTMDRDQVLYLVRSEDHPVPEELEELTQSELEFSREYKERTGIHWRHFYGPDGPRPPPVLHMWPASHIGQTHKVNSTEGFWTCDPNTKTLLSAAKCEQAPGGVELTLEVVSLKPRVFLIKNFFSNSEADEMIKHAKPRFAESTVGNRDAGGSRKSETRTSRNSWIKRSTSDITESLFKRAAHTLVLDTGLLNSEANAEEMQVVRYIDGAKYDSHHDWGVSGFPESRFITLLMYLTDQAKDGSGRPLGGETAFPKGYDGGGFKIHPGKGSAVLFYNLLEDGNGDDLALHAALPVEGNHEKLLSNFWVSSLPSLLSPVSSLLHFTPSFPFSFSFFQVWDPKRKDD